jgi:hypothetical protein
MSDDVKAMLDALMTAPSIPRKLREDGVLDPILGVYVESDAQFRERLSEAYKAPTITWTASDGTPSAEPDPPLSFHFDGTREELIEAFRQSVAEVYGEDRVEEIMAQQDWYTPAKPPAEGG